MKKSRNQALIFAYVIIRFFMDCFMSPLIICCALVSRLLALRACDVGLGPVPLINSPHHKKALIFAGYSAQTYVDSVYCITDEFDVRWDRIFKGPLWFFLHYFLFIRAIFFYKCLYIYFNGGPLRMTGFLRKLEPLLLKIAGTKVVVIPYGSDVQVMDRSRNPEFRKAMALDYPEQESLSGKVARNIDIWTKYADCVISGCEWVDYMPSWDRLCISHFSIDMDLWCPVENPRKSSTIRILHAPNHRNIKGTEFFIKAVEELQAEGADLELVLLERVSNRKIREEMILADIVADQLIIGWYAMFAIEAMSMGKPVLCYLREDLEELYIREGLLEKGEIPIINCSPDSVKEAIRKLIKDKAKMEDIGGKSVRYVEKHHSLEAIGRFFADVNKSIGLEKSA